jgi:hypothetical protein
MSGFATAAQWMRRISRRGCIAAVLVLAACARHIDSGETLPQPTAPPPVLTGPTEVHLFASVKLAQLERIGNQKLPAGGPVDVPLKFGIHLKGNWSRGALALTPAPPGFAFSLPRVHAEGSTPVRWSADASAAGSARPVVDAAYNIRSGAQLELHFNDAVIHVIAAWHLADLLNRHVSGILNREAEALDARLNQKLRLRERAAALWSGAFGVQKIDTRSTGVPLYLVHSPTRLMIANPQVTADGKVWLGLGLRGSLQLLAGGQAPPSPAPTPLPAVTLVPALDSGFSFDLPLVLSPAAVGQALDSAIAGGRIKRDLGRVRLERIELGGSGTQLVARVSLRAGGFWTHVDGSVCIQLEPYLDETTHTLAFRNVDFTAATKQALTRAAPWLVEPGLAQKIQDKLKLSLEPQETAARDALNRLGEDLGKRSRGMASVNVQQIRLASVQVQSGYLVLEVKATGQVATNLNPLDGS